MSDTENLLLQSISRFTAAVASGFCAIVAMRMLASIMSSELCGCDSVHAYMQLSHVYLVSTLDIMHVIKYTRLSPSIAGRAWERGYTGTEYSLGYTAMW